MGLSPRVRGNLAGHVRRDLPGRSIPACAGKPRRGEKNAPMIRVYPRVCGETCTWASPVPVG